MCCLSLGSWAVPETHVGRRNVSDRDMGHVAKGVDFPSKMLQAGSERKVVGRATAKVLTGNLPTGWVPVAERREEARRESRAAVKQSKSAPHLPRSVPRSTAGVTKWTCVQLICALSSLSWQGWICTLEPLADGDGG